MTRRACGYSQCGFVVSQVSQLGLCARHEQAAWKFLSSTPEERREALPCPVCGKRAASSRKTRICDACQKQNELKKAKVKANG